MPTMPRRATGWPILALAALLAFSALACITALRPTPALAHGTILVGGTAEVAFGASAVSVRTTPSWDADVVTLVSGGTVVDVIDGPTWDAAGAEWYGVAVAGVTGYMAADVLVGSRASVPPDTAAPAVTEAAPATAPTTATAAVYAAATTADLNLRAGPSTFDAVLLVMPAGSSLTVTGDGTNGFLPVSYQGRSGWAAAQYLTGSATSPPPTSQPAPSGGSAFVTTSLNLRAGPSTADGVLAVMPAGSTVALTGQSANGFLSVSYNGTAGWAFAAYLNQSGASPAPSPSPTPTPNPGGNVGTATVTTALNLRAGPSTADGVILVMPAGASVTLTGQSQNGFSGVVYNGTAGWAFATYLTGGGTPAPAPTPSPTPTPGPVTGTAVTTTSLNLRAGPSTADVVLAVMPAGVSVGITGGAQNGFYPVSYNGAAGWAFGNYLSIGGTPAPSPGPTPAPSTPPAAGGSGITWPFGSGEWYISQGYNGSSHYNSGSSYQYSYSLDLARVDRTTAGQAVLSPVSGTVRWTDPSTGGVSINLGNGYAVAFFHVAMDPSIRDGVRVSQGQYMGYISGPGGPGYVGFPHIHLTVWQTTDGGNWSRVAVPFTGANAIAGQSFPDVGGYNQHQGTRISR